MKELSKAVATAVLEVALLMLTTLIAHSLLGSWAPAVGLSMVVISIILLTVAACKADNPVWVFVFLYTLIQGLLLAL